MYVLFSKAT
jgi:hypothetical protein